MNNFEVEVIQSFKYLESIVYVVLHYELKTRTIQAELDDVFTQIQTTKRHNTVSHVYNTLVRTVAIYIMHEKPGQQENRLRCLEPKAQSKWRLKTSTELKQIFGKENII